jgi:hypothetical protein
MSSNLPTSLRQSEGRAAAPGTQMATAHTKHAQVPGLPPTPWWRTRRWQRYLRDLLLVRGRRRYTLSLSEQHPLGATDTRRRLVLINPTQLDVPDDAAARSGIRHLPPITATVANVAHSRRDVFQQAVTVGLVEHEAGHIRHSGTKPSGQTLAWLWNALEDERQERLQALAHPELCDLFDFLGDTVWYGTESTDRLLDGCLLWRWEHDRPAHERKFRPSTPEDAELWQSRVRPLVERAWAADTSEQVTAIARQILQVLGLPDDAPLPEHLPPSLCASGAGGAGEAGRRDASRTPPNIPPAAPAIPPGAQIPGQLGQVGGGAGSGAGHDPDHPAEADPEPLLAAVEGAARDLARWLRPPTPHVRARPDPARGELQLERALDGHARPFDRKVGPAPAPSRAWLLLIDLSGSMGDARRPEQPLYGAVRAAMWLDRAAELAGVPLGILAFDDGERPIRIRSLASGPDRLARRRIAGMEAGGGTRLAPAFTAAVAVLRVTPAQHKLLLVLHDGDLNADDATRVRQRVAALPRLGIRLQPLYLGTDDAIVAANERVFGRVGHVLACRDLAGMTARLRAWLRASGA